MGLFKGSFSLSHLTGLRVSVISSGERQGGCSLPHLQDQAGPLSLAARALGDLASSHLEQPHPTHRPLWAMPTPSHARPKPCF